MNIEMDELLEFLSRDAESYFEGYEYDYKFAPHQIRISYVFLSHQVHLNKNPSRSFKPLKNIIKHWAGCYVSQESVEQAAKFHPKIFGEYRNGFNLKKNKKLIIPPDEYVLRLRTIIPEVMSDIPVLKDRSEYLRSKNY